MPLSLELEPWQNLRQGPASPEIRLYRGYGFLRGLDLPCTSAHFGSPQLTSAHFGSPQLTSAHFVPLISFFYHVFLVSIFDFSACHSSSFCQILFLYLVICGFRKELVMLRAIYSGPALVSFLLFLLLSLRNNLSFYLSSLDSFFFSPVFIRACYIVLLPVYWSRPLVWSIDFLLHLSSFSASYLSSLCLSFKYTTTALLSPSLVTFSPTSRQRPSPVTSSISCGLSCHGFAREPSYPTSTLYSHSPRPLLNLFVTLYCISLQLPSRQPTYTSLSRYGQPYATRDVYP